MEDWDINDRHENGVLSRTWTHRPTGWVVGWYYVEHLRCSLLIEDDEADPWQGNYPPAIESALDQMEAWADEQGRFLKLLGA